MIDSATRIDATPGPGGREFFSLVVEPATRFEGSPVIPGDKSMSHRVLIMAALAHGRTRITNLLDAEDVGSTRRVLEALGVRIDDEPGGAVVVYGVGGVAGFQAPAAVLDCGNSGTTMRLMMGVLAAAPFRSVLDGDASLRRRPMRRIAAPLRTMGATIALTGDERAPVTIDGAPLHGIDYALPIPSGQLKGALALAALAADGATHLTGELGGRDHTERLLWHFGASIQTDGAFAITPGALRAADVRLPGDPSSAAFWIAAATLVPDASIVVRDVSLNPTRLGFVRALRRMGAKITLARTVDDPEPAGSITVEASRLHGITIGAADVPAMIDELPLIAVLATYAYGVTEVRGAEDLRVKESDRIAAVAENLQRMGAEIEVFDDGFRIAGPQRLHGAEIVSHDDHRIAMAFAVAALGATTPVTIDDASCVAISYPAFVPTLRYLTGATMRAGVLGTSVTRSQSPAIFNWLAAATGARIAYERLACEPAGVAGFLAAMRRDGAYLGCNVTIPHKERVAALVDRRSRIAEIVGAVNVVARRANGSLDGHNTDVAGIAATFALQQLDLRGARALVIGAGGAAAAVIFALHDAGAREIAVRNRTPERAAALIARLKRRLPSANVVLERDAAPGAYAVAIDATPGGAFDADLAPGGCAIGLAYGSPENPFLVGARARGFAAVDGLPMLVAQAIATFEIWYRDGVRFDEPQRTELFTGFLAHLRAAAR